MGNPRCTFMYENESQGDLGNKIKHLPSILFQAIPNQLLLYHLTGFYLFLNIFHFLHNYFFLTRGEIYTLKAFIALLQYFFCVLSLAYIYTINILSVSNSAIYIKVAFCSVHILFLPPPTCLYLPKCFWGPSSTYALQSSKSSKSSSKIFRFFL